MKTLFIDCYMGAAGDMLMAALLELSDNREAFLCKMNQLGLEGVTVAANQAQKCGIMGTGMEIKIHGEEEESHDHNHSHDHHHEHDEHHDHNHNHDHDHEHHHDHDHDHHHDHNHNHDHDHDHDHEHHHDHDHEHHHDHSHGHHHTSMADIQDMIEKMDIPQKVKEDAIAVYGLIADAESKAHGKPVDQIHFHEVGSLDAVVDVVGVCLLMHELNPEKIVASPVHVGSGMVRCAHGILPVPAPATMHILQNVPTYSGEIKGELCTPTGAALLKHFVTDFEKQPMMSVNKIGYGMGKKDFPVANCVRVVLGEEDVQVMDEISELVCNLDDITPEDVGYVSSLLMEEGALDVYTTNIYMKKNRPGLLFTCMCPSRRKKEFIELILKHTTTLGVREYTCKRYGLNRRMETVETEYGPVRKKISEGYGIVREKYEFEDMAKIAKENHLSVSQVRQTIIRNDV